MMMLMMMMTMMTPVSAVTTDRAVCHVALVCVEGRGVDPYGTGGTRPPNIWTGGT